MTEKLFTGMLNNNQKLFMLYMNDLHPILLQEPKEKKTHRDKQSREEAKAEKRAEKESKREEKHDRIKLKRSYTPDYEERDHHREREWEEARGSSVTSNGSHKSHTQPSPDESPRYVDDRGKCCCIF